MPETTYEIAYEVASKALSDQRESLTNLRTRSATLFSAAAIVTSFLGAQALDDTKVMAGTNQLVADRTLQAWEAVGIGCFIGVAVLTILILLPWPGWTFRVGARDFIRDYSETDPPATVQQAQRDLALHLENHYDGNESKLKWLFWGFRVAAAVLAFEVVAWLLDLT
jgi:hypothetical protein